METDRCGYAVRGRVQGVGFRWWTRRTAERLRVMGTVRNLSDGSVEVMAEADPDALAAFASELDRGPSAARVDSVEVIEFRGGRGGFDGFTIER